MDKHYAQVFCLLRRRTSTWARPSPAPGSAEHPDGDLRRRLRKRFSTTCTRFLQETVCAIPHSRGQTTAFRGHHLRALREACCGRLAAPTHLELRVFRTK